MKISVSPKIFEKYPDVSEYIIVVRGLNNRTKYSREIINELRRTEDEVREKLDINSFVEQPRYKAWIDNYNSVLAETEANKSFRKDVYPAHVALTKRVLSGKDLPNINPLVNYYNLISIKYGVPYGGEDLSTYYGDAMLAFADGDEKYLGIGENKIDTVYKGEVQWEDALSVTCRMWGWRQSDRTKVIDTTQDVVFYVDVVGGTLTEEELHVMFDEFEAGMLKYFNAKSVQVYELNKDHNEVEIDYEGKSVDEIPENAMELLENELSVAEKGNKGIRKRRAESMELVDETQFVVKLENSINETLGLGGEGEKFRLSASSDLKFGDYSSTVALQLAKIQRKNPKEIAEQIVDSLNSSGKFDAIFKEISVAGNGYINFTFSDDFIKQEMASALNNEGFGSSEVGEGRVIAVESPGWNPNKTPHVGHMLNLFLGQTLLRLFNKVGFEAVSDDINNDKGLPVMQSIWAYKKYADGATPDSTDTKPDLFVNKYYAIGKKEYDESEEAKNQIKETLRKWEAGDEEVRAIWKNIVNWAFEGQEQTIETFGEKYTAHRWLESKVYEGGKDIVMSHLGDGVIEKLPDGAVIARIEQEYGLPDTIVMKSDGTGLYHTQDIGLTVAKKEKFNAWRLIWVVAEEQIAHFQRLFAILDALDIMPIDNLYHYAYGWVVGKDGKKLSSRDGAELSADELYVNLFGAAKAILNDRGVGEDEVDKIARAVAIGAIKYSFLSRDPYKTIKFDMDEAVSFNGKSGPYIMYSYTRAESIISKADRDLLVKSVEDIKDFELTQYDRELVLKLLQYPRIVLDSANQYYPGILAEYLYDLAKTFSSFYENVAVMNAETDDEKKGRLMLLELFAYVIKDGLAILGIDVLESM